MATRSPPSPGGSPGTSKSGSLDGIQESFTAISKQLTSVKGDISTLANALSGLARAASGLEKVASAMERIAIASHSAAGAGGGGGRGMSAPTSVGGSSSGMRVASSGWAAKSMSAMPGLAQATGSDLLSGYYAQVQASTDLAGRQSKFTGMLAGQRNVQRSMDNMQYINRPYVVTANKASAAWPTNVGATLPSNMNFGSQAGSIPSLSSPRAAYRSIMNAGHMARGNLSPLMPMANRVGLSFGQDEIEIGSEMADIAAGVRSSDATFAPGHMRRARGQARGMMGKYNRRSREMDAEESSFLLSQNRVEYGPTGWESEDAELQSIALERKSTASGTRGTRGAGRRGRKRAMGLATTDRYRIGVWHGPDSMTETEEMRSIVAEVTAGNEWYAGDRGRNRVARSQAQQLRTDAMQNPDFGEYRIESPNPSRPPREPWMNSLTSRLYNKLGVPVNAKMISAAAAYGAANTGGWAAAARIFSHPVAAASALSVGWQVGKLNEFESRATGHDARNESLYVQAGALARHADMDSINIHGGGIPEIRRNLRVGALQGAKYGIKAEEGMDIMSKFYSGAMGRLGDTAWLRTAIHDYASYGIDPQKLGRAHLLRWHGGMHGTAPGFSPQQIGATMMNLAESAGLYGNARQMVVDHVADASERFMSSGARFDIGAYGSQLTGLSQMGSNPFVTAKLTGDLGKGLDKIDIKSKLTGIDMLALQTLGGMPSGPNLSLGDYEDATQRIANRGYSGENIQDFIQKIIKMGGGPGMDPRFKGFIVRKSLASVTGNQLTPEIGQALAAAGIPVGAAGTPLGPSLGGGRAGGTAEPFVAERAQQDSDTLRAVNVARDQYTALNERTKEATNVVGNFTEVLQLATNALNAFVRIFGGTGGTLPTDPQP